MPRIRPAPERVREVDMARRRKREGLVMGDGLSLRVNGKKRKSLTQRRRVRREGAEKNERRREKPTLKGEGCGTRNDKVWRLGVRRYFFLEVVSYPICGVD